MLEYGQISDDVLLREAEAKLRREREKEAERHRNHVAFERFCGRIPALGRIV